MKCPKCMAIHRLSAKFCSECGSPLNNSKIHNHTKNSSSKTYLDENEGERRHATVVFSDLSGYTVINEKLDPEEVASLMNTVKRAAIEIVEAEGGMVNQFVGDEVVSLFGVPIAHENDAVRAVRATLALHDFVKKISEDFESRYGISLSMHSGINTGLVLVRPSELDGKFSITGDAVNTGARLYNLAKKDEIIIGPETNRQVCSQFRTKTLRTVQLKGKAQNYIPYKIEGKIQGPLSHSHASSPFIGREEELNLLLNLFHKTSMKQGQFAVVKAEPGMGKSRLFMEFQNKITTNAKVWSANCQVEDPRLYSPFVKLIYSIAQVNEGSKLDESLSKIERSLLSYDPNFHKYLPVVFSVIGVNHSKYKMEEGVSGDKINSLFMEAVSSLFAAASKHQTLVVLLDDWQWSDTLSDKMLGRLIEFIAPLPIMIAVNHRTGYASTWKQVDHCTECELSNLEKVAAKSLIKKTWEAVILPDGISDFIHMRTGGNPFFIEELCHSMSDDGTIKLVNGEVVLQKAIPNIVLPSSVFNVIQARIDMLDDKPKELLKTASVIGKEFGGALILELMKDDETKDCLEVLKNKNLIQNLGANPEEFSFKHSLIHQVVYESLLIQSRKKIHALVGHVIEDVFKDRIDEHLEELAYHYEHSDESERYLHYLMRSADRAARLFSVKAADIRYANVLKHLDKLKLTDDIRRKYIEVSLKAAPFSHKNPTLEKIKILQKARLYAEEIKDIDSQILFTYWIGMMFNYMGDNINAQKHYLHSIEMGEHLQKKNLIVLPYNQMGRSCLFSLDLEEGVRYLKIGIELFESQKNETEAAISLAYLGLEQAYMGKFEEAHYSFEHCFAKANQIKNPMMLSTINQLHALAYLKQGKWSDAVKVTVQAHDMAKDIDLETVTTSSLGLQGYAKFMLGNKEMGVDLINLAFEKVKILGAHVVSSVFYGLLAEVYALSGYYDKCEDVALEALAFAENTGMKIGKGEALRALAWSKLKNGESDTALELIDSSIEWARSRKAEPELSLSLYRKTLILKELGKTEEAKQVLGETIKLWKNLKMTWWLNRIVQK